MKTRVCELCNGEATVYCPSDSAFLCWNCDFKVHQANFLVARHVRLTVCSSCKGLTGDRISGAGLPVPGAFCPTCSPASSDTGCLDSLSSCSEASACISSTRSGSDRRCKRRSDLSTSVGEFPGEVSSKAEGILVNWQGKLGIGGECVVRAASCALRACRGNMTFLSPRVCLGASLWFGLRYSDETGSSSTWQVLKRLEQISGVPAKIIAAAESKLERVLKVRKQRLNQLEEGWDEC